MAQKKREALAKLVVTFYKNQTNPSKKSTISHFVKAGVPRSTLYRILKKCAEHGTATFFPKSGRPAKISTRQVKALVKKSEQ
jgi:transposase